MRFLTKIKHHALFITVVFIIYVLGIFTITYKPLMPEVEALKNTYPLFSLSLISFVILLSIGAYLLYRWKIMGRTNITNLVWGISFIFYSLLFFGMMLQALGFQFANTKLPQFFFVWRQFQIIWAAGMYYGVARIITKSKILQQVPTVLIIFFGYLWFVYGLFFSGVSVPIEYMMYGFLHFIWIPLNALLAYLFILFAKKSKLKSPYFLSLGFAGIAITYILWAPWHLTKFYFVCFSLFVLSLIPLLIGFLMIPLERRCKIS